MKLKKAVAISTAFGVALAGLALTTPAYADPVSNSYVLVGSDTLDASANALANGTVISGSYVRVTANGNTIASFDAFPRGVITTKPQGVTFVRPEGSGAGAKALSRTIDGAAYKVTYTGTTAYLNNTAVVLKGADKSSNAVDIARESSLQGNSNTGSGPILHIPYGRDAVSYAIKAGSGVTAAGITAASSYTATQLNGIYYNTGAAKTVDNGDGTTSTIVPKLPQSASGTRQFFLTAIGGAKTDNPAGVTGADTTALAENDATVLTPGAGEIWIIPFSAASWIAQVNGANPVNTTAGTTLGTPAGVAPFTGSGTALVANPVFYYGTGASGSTTFGRDTYLAVEWIRLQPKLTDNSANPDYDANLAALLDQTLPKSLTYFPVLANNATNYSPASSAAVKVKFGFLAPASDATSRRDLVAN